MFTLERNNPLVTESVHDIPAVFLAGERAPAPRTLVDIVERTVEEAPDAIGLDSGAQTLTYAEFHEAARTLAGRLGEAGIGRGARVGVRIKSGTTDLYVAIVGTLLAGAAYVPVDADDPDERARVVFTEAGVAAVLGNDLSISLREGGPRGLPGERPTPDDDAWIIFTSGSTGTPKGVAVTHRNAAAFVDAEARMFLQDNPIGPQDRVMAGLSVAFDASCEEMWLAWAHGAALVPAPRSLVRSGVDVGPWLVANDITVVSTVPTLVALWPASSLDRVRLLIMGGEACPAELAARLQAPGREVWNTYGPTEATVVACGAILDGTDPVRIGLPLEGWDLAVVDEHGQPVAEGESGELIIGGVGLARYLDPAKDAEKYAPMPTLGWERAYRSGDVWSTTRQGCCSPVARTTRSSSVAAASNWARSTASCCASRASPELRPRCGPRSRGTSCSSAISRSTTPMTPRPRSPCCGSGCRPRWCRAWPWWMTCPPRPRARSTGTPCRGPCPGRAPDPRA